MRRRKIKIIELDKFEKFILVFLCLCVGAVAIIFLG